MSEMNKRLAITTLFAWVVSHSKVSMSLVKVEKKPNTCKYVNTLGKDFSFMTRAGNVGGFGGSTTRSPTDKS